MRVGLISKIDKLEEKFRRNPIAKDLTFADARRLLEHYGCEFFNGNGGSHYTISNSQRTFPTTIADHGILKRYNVKDVLKIVDEIKEGNKNG